MGTTNTTRSEQGLRERKKQETRAAIHRAALSLVADRRLGDVTVDEIATAAGVSARTFFNYFPTKDAAVVGTSVDLAAGIEAGVLARPESEEIRESVFAVLLTLVPSSVEPDVVSQRREILRSHPELLASMFGLSRDTEDALARAIARRLGLDVESDPYPRILAVTSLAALRSVIGRPGPDETAPELLQRVRAAFDLLAGGLAWAPDLGSSSAPS
jgi:AcrR family transcriptional regulator